MYQLGGNTINLTAASDFWELESTEGRVMDGVAPELGLCHVLFLSFEYGMCRNPSA